jgi:hypothetical protein
MSGSTIGGVIGAAVGYFFGAPQVGWMIGSAIGGYVDPTQVKGPRLTDAQGITVTEGSMRPIGYGTFVAGGNIMQCGPLVEKKHKDRVGKGSGQVSVTYTYSRSFAVRICEGPVGGILRIWMDGKLMYDARNPTEWPEAAAAIASMAADTAKFASAFVFYSGSETQQSDPTLQSLPTEYGGGYGNVPAYRGTAYIVFPNFDLTDRQGSVPQFRFEVACCGATTTTATTAPWVHGSTGSIQSVHSIGVSGTSFYTAGDNGALMRSADSGATWAAVNLSGSGIGSSEALYAVWPSWYVASGTSVSTGSTLANMASVGATRHALTQGSASYVGGAMWAGASGTTHTTIFQPLASTNTDIDLGGDYGTVSTVGLVSGRMVVGCGDGTLRDTSGNVLFSSGGRVEQVADGNGVAVAATDGSYWRTTNGGTTWTQHTDHGFLGVVYAKGQFYGVNHESVYTSPDGLTWTLADTFAPGNTLDTLIGTDGSSVFACTQQGITTTQATAYNLPDIATGWWVDLDGTVHGTTSTVTAKCTATVADIVRDVCLRAGLTDAQLDLMAVEADEVRGFLIGRQMAAAEAIRALQPWSSFDLVEWGDYTDASTKLRAVKRGGPALFDITDDDLIASDDDQETRAQAVEFPRKINVLAPDLDADYNPTKETAERQTQDVRAVGEQTVEVPISMNRTEKAQLADKMLRIAWTEAEGKLERQLPENFSVLTPSDPFTYGGKRWRADRVEYGDGVVKVEAVRDRISAYVSTASGSTAINPTPPALRLRGPTVISAMNLPPLVTQQNTPGMVVAVTGLLDGWIGCDLQLSVDGGQTYQSVAQILVESTMGDLTADCGTSGTVSIRLLHGHTMDTVSDAQIAARQNAWAVTTDGVSEVGQSQTVDETDATDTTTFYDLTDSTRGELSTTNAAHYTGDRFVLLDGNTTFVPIDVKYAGQTLLFRPVSIGTVPENNRAYPFLYAPIYTSAPSIDFYKDQNGVVYTDETGAYYEVT